MHTRRRSLGARAAMAGGFALLVAAGTACAGSSQSGLAAVYGAGQVPKSELPSQGGGAKGNSSNSTIPLAQQNPTTQLFAAIGTFQSCLQGLGVTFIGAPTPNNPNDPTNNPSYIKSLTTCAAQSNILQALKAEQTAQQNLTQAQVHTENKDYLKWRTCMIARGWGIPQPTPNAQGLLFSFGAGSGSVTNITPPAGKSLFSTSDMEACAAKAVG